MKRTIKSSPRPTTLAELMEAAAPKLTRKQQRENADRRNRALTVLAQYAEITGTEDEAAPLWAADLLADILHLLGEAVFDKCLRTARMHYEAERNGEP
jgi:hypothetical protein